jgi:hypothetical protein
LFHVENENTSGLGGASAVGRIDNAGIFRKAAGTGTTLIAGGLSFNNSGTVDIRSGKLAVNGGYISSSNALLNCALGGTTAGTGYGQLQKSGTITLNGALSLDFINGFVPTTNDSFAVLTAGTRNGTFSTFTYPSNAVTMQLSNTATSVIAFVSGLVMPNPVLLQPELAGSDFKLCWTATSNVTYRVEFNPDLNQTNWSALAGNITATNDPTCLLDPLTTSNRFYRVRVVP